MITQGIPKEFRELTDSAIDHIGTMLDNMDFQKALDVAIYAGLAKLGYDQLPEILPIEVRLLFGPIAFRLATTPSSEGKTGVSFLGTGVEFPVNSQIAGLSMLGILGFACLPWQSFIENFNETVEANKDAKAAYDLVKRLPLEAGELEMLESLYMEWALGYSRRFVDKENALTHAKKLSDYCQLLEEKYMRMRELQAAELERRIAAGEGKYIPVEGAEFKYIPYDQPGGGAR